MPALPDRSGRPLPDTADVVVIGGGYTGINAARELARRGVAVTLLEARTLGWGASTRNGGIVHPGYKWGPRELVERYGEETGRALYRETLDGYETVKRLIAEESIDCDFRERRPPRARLRAVARRRASSTSARASPRWASSRASSRASGSARRSASDAYYGALVVPGSGAAPPRPVLRRARRRRGPGRRGPPRGRPGADDPAPGRRPVRRRDRARRDPRPRRLRRHERLHGRRRPERCAAGSSRSAATSSPPSRSPRSSRASSRPRAARSSTPRTSSTTGTSRRTGGWSSAAGRASCRPRSSRPPAILHRGLLEVHPQLAGRPDRLRVGRQRRVHVRPDAARRPDEGRRHLRDGLLRDRASR